MVTGAAPPKSENGSLKATDARAVSASRQGAEQSIKPHEQNSPKLVSHPDVVVNGRAPAQPPSWLQELGIWSTFAQAVLALVGLIGLAVTVVYARRAWIAAATSAKAASDALTAQRAYIFVDKITVEPVGVKPDIQMRLNFYWKNFGSTPAINVSQNIRIAFVDPENISDDEIIGDGVLDKSMSMSVAQGHYSLGYQYMQMGDLAAAHKGKLRVFLCGDIVYRDIFFPDQRKTRHVCEVVVDLEDYKDFEDGGFSMGKANIGFVIHGNYSVST